MAVDNSKPTAIPVNLKPPARRIIEKIRDDTGVPNTEAMSRILEWFAGLNWKLRQAVLNRDAEARRELLMLAVHDMMATNLTHGNDVKKSDPQPAPDATVPPPKRGKR